MVILAPIAAMLIQMAISRSREYQADASGARLAGRPWGLAKALEKLDIASKLAPMDATPATAHLFIVNPLTRRRAEHALLDPSPDRGADRPAPRDEPVVRTGRLNRLREGRRHVVSPLSVIMISRESPPKVLWADRRPRGPLARRAYRPVRGPPGPQRLG